MPRLEASFGPDGPIIDVQIWTAAARAEELAAEGREIPPPICVPGLVDTGAEATAIRLPIIDWMGIPSHGALGDAHPPKWRTIRAVGVHLMAPGASVLIGRDLLASCRFTDDGRKHRLLMSY